MQNLRPPKMIMFDYGETIIHEDGFSGLLGTEAVLKSCVEDSKGVSAEEMHALVAQLNREIRKGEGYLNFDIEVHNHIFTNYLYDYFGMELSVSKTELEWAFWQAAAPAVPVDGAADMLNFLKQAGIRSGVVSNISFSGETLKRRIDLLLPGHSFEFIIASSEYIFRKPHPRIFELALKKSGLAPDEVWFAGDNVVWDVDGSAAAGMTPIWFKKHLRLCQDVPSADCIELYEWEQLVEVLKKL